MLVESQRVSGLIKLVSFTRVKTDVVAMGVYVWDRMGRLGL